jgi:Zn-dependent protease
MFFSNPGSVIQLLAAALIPVLFGIVLHEVAHGWAARWLGDRTAELLGRLSLNPLKHVDPVGTVLVPVVTGLLGAPFGWAKPVPVSGRNLRYPRRDMVIVAAAGPASNALMATFWAAAYVFLLREGLFLGQSRTFFIAMAQIGVGFNVLLAVFNLVPIPPLDGGRVLRGLVPRGWGNRLDAVEPYGLIIVMGLLVAGVLGRLIGPTVQSLTNGLLRLANSFF